MLTVIDNDLGNIGSVIRAIEYLNLKFKLTRDLKEIEQAEKLIFPGVGSFKAASEKILTKEFRTLIRHLVLDRHIPIFGFCLGMQLLTELGEEMGQSEGLGLIKGKTSKLRVNPEKFPIPHMGWNDVQANELKMFKNVPAGTCFYFVHSFEVSETDTNVKIAHVNYGDTDICAAIEKDHIWGAQFHPEKSQRFGLELIKNFNQL